jgi:hypothetical protein
LLIPLKFSLKHPILKIGEKRKEIRMTKPSFKEICTDYADVEKYLKQLEVAYESGDQSKIREAYNFLTGSVKLVGIELKIIKPR